MIQRQEGSSLLDLAGLLAVEGLAGLISGSFWGRMSDQASHRVMAQAAALSGRLHPGASFLILNTAVSTGRTHGKG